MRSLLCLIVVVTPCSVCSAAPDRIATKADGSSRVLVDKPQEATIWRKNRPVTQVWLVRLTPDELTCKLTVSGSLKRWLALDGSVQAIELANGDVYRLDPKKEFAPFDPMKDAFIGRKPAGKTQGAAAITEVAEGSGTTGDEAIRDALRNAVRKALGVLVDGEVLIQKEEVISDRVLTYSDGFVTAYDELSRKYDEGLVRVTIRAQVEQHKLLNNLREAGVGMGAVDGKGLVASALTRKEALDSAAALLNKALGQLPNVLTAEVQPPSSLDYDADTQLLNLNVAIRIDRPKYNALVDSLCSTLKEISLARGTLLLQALPSLGNGDNLLDWSQGPLGPVVRFGPDLSGNPKTWCMWLCKRGDEHNQTVRFCCYALDANIAQSLQQTRGTFQVQIDLLDASKETIASDIFDPLAGMKRRPYWLGWLAPRPRRLVEQFADESSAGLVDSMPLAALTQAVGSNLTVNAYVAPICVVGLANGNIVFSRGIWQARQLKIAPEKLSRMKEIRSRIVFVPATSPTASTGGH